ncbi:sugar porter family MFS transporter, partial [Bacteroidota bacterium]
ITIYQLAITMGILISYIVNYGLHDVENNWRWMFATGLIPSVVFFTGLIFIPESPRWLMKRGLKEKAVSVLKRINGIGDVEEEAREIELSISDADGKTNILTLFKPVYRKVIILGFLLAVFVQISGINTVIDYAPKILMAAGLEIKNALLQTSLIGIVNFTFTFIALWLIDKVGRKMLYIVGSAGMAIALIMMAIAFHFELAPGFTTIFIMLFIAFFASCIGPAFWTLVAEMFPNQIRGTAVAMISFTQWVFNFLVVLLFPHLLEAIGGSMTFLFLAFMSALQLLIASSISRKPKGKLWKR